MEKFTQLRGVAAPLDMVNVDTDLIIPKQHLKTIERTGLGKYLLDELRYNEDGSEKEDFVLNQPAYRDQGKQEKRCLAEQAKVAANCHFVRRLAGPARCLH